MDEILIKKREKAKRYASEPERFLVDGGSATLKSDHGIRHLRNDGSGWVCDCEFFDGHQTCSHAMAVIDFLAKKEN